MKIRHTVKTACFADVKNGDVFTTSSGRFYIAIEDIDDEDGLVANAVELQTGRPLAFKNYDPVTLVNCELVIMEKEVE